MGITSKPLQRIVERPSRAEMKSRSRKPASGKPRVPPVVATEVFELRERVRKLEEALAYAKEGREKWKRAAIALGGYHMRSRGV